MNTATILAKIQDVLQDSAFLSYVTDGNIFLGFREGISIFPCLIIEPISNKMAEESYPYEDLSLMINVTGYIQTFNKDKQLAGDANTKGVLDFENDVKKALSADYTLGLSDVVDTRLVSTAYDFEQYPVRGFSINVEVLFKQDRTTR